MNDDYNEKGLKSPATIIGFLILVILIIWGVWIAFNKDDEGARIDTANWITYVNEEFDFSIKHPPSWRVATSSEPFAPKVTIYKPGVLTALPPFDHFANATHVSVFPRGIPTEGEFADREDSSVDLKEEVADGKDLILEDGTVFASSYWFKNPPESWDDAGFLWTKVRIDNAETKCFRGDEQVEESDCDPLSGDRIVWSGTLSRSDRLIEEEMLKSFEFSEEGGELSDMIRLDEPKENSIIKSPLRIRGEARGNWYFEASFPAKILDANGKVVKQFPIQADGEWMTTEFVPFDETVSFAMPTSATGTLVLEKDNPSGLPENASEIRIPIRFR